MSVSGFIPTGTNTAVNSVLNTATITASVTNQSLSVRGDVCVEGGDIIVDGVSMKQLLEGVSARLAILIPDPDKLEKYEALRQAYEHYRTLEALCYENT